MATVYNAYYLCIANVVRLAGGARTTWAQSFGIELHSTLMPASGGMAGASLAKPQDLLSAIAGNPATLTQFRGTNFTFGGGWVEPTYNLSHTGGILPNFGQFSAKSETEGSLLGNIGVTHDLDVIGLPATWSVGLLSQAGAGLSYRNVPASNGTSVSFSVLQMGSGVGVRRDGPALGRCDDHTRVGDI